MTELYINGILVDLDDVIALSKAINDLGQIESREGEYSNTIGLNMTKTNCNALGHIQDINSISQITKQNNTFEIYDDGVLVTNGIARVLSVSDTFEVQLYGSNSDWSILIENKSLRELDFSDLNYNLTYPNVIARRLLLADLCCPNVWYGGFFAAPTQWTPLDFLPAIYFPQIFEKIFTQIGFTLDMNLSTLNQALYNKLIPIFSRKKLPQGNGDIEFKGTFAAADNSGAGYNLSPVYLGGDYCEYISDYTILSNGFPLTGKGVSFVSGASPSIDSITDVCQRLVGYVSFTITAQAAPYDVELRAAGVTAIGAVEVFAAGTYRIDFDVTNPDQIFSPHLVFTGTLSGNYRIVGGEFTFYNRDAVRSSVRWDGINEFVVHASQSLPDIKQSEFCQTVFSLFGLVSTTDTILKKVTVNELDKIIADIPNAEDWSNKIDLSEDIEILFDFWDDYFRRNNFIYKNDDKDLLVADSGLGDGYMDYDSNYVDQEDEVIEIRFSAIARDENLTPDLASCSSRLYGDLNWKIGYTTVTVNNLITMNGQAAPTQSLEVFFDDLHFNILIERNYELLKKALENSIAAKVLFRLTRFDYESMDFTKPIFLNVQTKRNGLLRGHFYVNKIEQYIVGEFDSCWVTLIKID